MCACIYECIYIFLLLCFSSFFFSISSPSRVTLRYTQTRRAKLYTTQNLTLSRRSSFLPMKCMCVCHVGTGDRGDHGRDRCNRRGKTSRACKLCVCCIRSKGDSFVEREKDREREMKKAIDVLASLSSTQARHPRKAERYTNVSSGMNARVCTCRYKKTRTCKLALSSIPPRCSLRCPCLEGFSLYKK